MSDAVLERARGRAGELACVCDADLPGAEPSAEALTGRSALLPLALANGFSVLAQALTVSVLPVAGVVLAPNSPASSLPFVALLIGAGLASLPAAYLTTGWDRRFGFALGASMGLAGACMAAWAIASAQFGALVLGAFWMGVAQGFAAFYRHGAAQTGRIRAIGIVVGSGALAALLAPALVDGARSLAGPLLPAALLISAGVAYLAVLAADLLLPPPPLSRMVANQDTATSHFLPATLAASLSWFAMAAAMGSAPLRMIDCGISLDDQTGTIAWHLLAMYLPAMAAGLLIRPQTRTLFIGAGLTLCIAGLLVLSLSRTGTLIGAGLILAGFGWSTTMVAATSLLHAQGTPKRGLLAAHDLSSLVAAAAGAACAGLLH